VSSFASTRSPDRVDSDQARAPLDECFAAARHASVRLCEPLSPEDCAAQSMPDASPAKWHLGHTTWFFEMFLLARFDENHRPFHEGFNYLFNSYYNAMGARQPRPKRGLLTRPSFEEVLRYRRDVDEAVRALIDAAGSDRRKRIESIIEVGLHHEQQHQELLLTDVKHLLSCNPLLPAYREDAARREAPRTAMDWLGFEEGLRSIGHDGQGFSFDNERPRHREFVEAFEIADRLVTNVEYLEFIKAGGYERAALWLDEGWRIVQSEGWSAPLYWLWDGGRWLEFTLAGPRPLDPHEPVCHVSYFEADAFARWAGARLPSEAEWEVASESGGFGAVMETDSLHPQSASEPAGPLRQAFGDAWEWTRSPYTPYPGFRPEPGALGEYNGKFMCNQQVLRGGSCATPTDHIRATYRNFFPPQARWQFAGVRLARDAS